MEIYAYPDGERDFDGEPGGDPDLDRDLAGERREDLGLGDLLQLRYRVSMGKNKKQKINWFSTFTKLCHCNWSNLLLLL